MSEKFDLILVGTGFATSFFLLAYLEQASPTSRVLVLERGQLDTHRWQIENRRTSSTDPTKTFINKNQKKAWIYNPSFGGGSNCWWAVTPRMMPNDFQLHSLYGVGVDWPLTYEELEPFYGEAEAIMAVSGASDDTPFPRSTPYPQPPHRFSDPDRLFKTAYPDSYFHLPTARARQATGKRPACCATGVCKLCPINAKFTILNELPHLYEDPRVTLQLGATVQTVETQGGLAAGVTYQMDDAIHQADGELVALGANAIFNPHILNRSDIHHPLLGKYLNEQVVQTVFFDLDGVDNFQGSTSMTGHGYMLYDGEHRQDRAACLIESWNVPMPILGHPLIRLEHKKWRQQLMLKFVYEDLPLEQNYVKFDASNPDIPETIYVRHSDYAQKAIDILPDLLPNLVKPLPVENVTFSPLSVTESHVLGTVVMGNDPQTSVVDRHLIHHDIRNLLVLGGSSFPTTAPANPTLTISALSLWAAAHLFG